MCGPCENQETPLKSRESRQSTRVWPYQQGKGGERREVRGRWVERPGLVSRSRLEGQYTPNTRLSDEEVGSSFLFFESVSHQPFEFPRVLCQRKEGVESLDHVDIGGRDKRRRRLHLIAFCGVASFCEARAILAPSTIQCHQVPGCFERGIRVGWWHT